MIGPSSHIALVGIVGGGQHRREIRVDTRQPLEPQVRVRLTNQYRPLGFESTAGGGGVWRRPGYSLHSNGEVISVPQAEADALIEANAAQLEE